MRVVKIDLGHNRNTVLGNLPTDCVAKDSEGNFWIYNGNCLINLTTLNTYFGDAGKGIWVTKVELLPKGTIITFEHIVERDKM